jgi:microtubule-associated protein-like 6
MTLDYVYGYRVKDCRNNCFLLNGGSVLYNAAALGIVLDPTTNT